MPIAGKIFLLKEESDINSIATRLKDFRSEEAVDIDDKGIVLITEIRDLGMVGDDLRGIFARDQLINVSHHGKSIPVPITTEAPFIFTKHDDRILLIILERKLRANNIANQFSKILFITTGQIIEAKIPPDVFRKFHEDNFEDTKVIFFDDVDIPNVNKLSLYGSDLGDTSLYRDYCSHGNVWYTVLKPAKYGFIVGITRKCVVTFFSKVDEREFIDYAKKEIFPLIAC